jgi:hypothetical protein
LSCGDNAPEMPWGAWESVHGGSRKWFPEQHRRSVHRESSAAEPATLERVSTGLGGMLAGLRPARGSDVRHSRAEPWLPRKVSTGHIRQPDASRITPNLRAWRSGCHCMARARDASPGGRARYPPPGSQARATAGDIAAAPHGQDRAGQLTPPASSSWTSACQAWTVRKPPGGSPAPGTAAAHPHPDDLRPGHYIYGALCACAGGFLLKDVAGYGSTAGYLRSRLAV